MSVCVRVGGWAGGRVVGGWWAGGGRWAGGGQVGGCWVGASDQGAQCAQVRVDTEMAKKHIKK